MSNAVVGAARVVFGADTSEFDTKAKGVEGVLGRIVDKFSEIEKKLRIIGAGVTVGITLPFAGMVRAVDQGAGAFEAQMNRVEAALDGVTGKQLKELSDQARNLGPAVGKGATEAAAGIEALGLAGVSTADIIDGGLKATLDLAAAGMVNVSTSAALVTDVFGQFHKKASDLPEVVTNVVGALDASKFGFEDFQLAVSQGGGVAASAGVSFRDFATAVAATSTQFSSGSDAGTSFKTYMQSLVGNSDDAKYAMKKLGIEFFDTNGRLKPLAEQAQLLRDKLGGLSDVTKTDALKRIFGSDAARTAIGLMEQGREGFERLQATIEGGNVNAKIAKRMEGDAAAGVRIANAWESVKIAIGETGLLDIITRVKNAFASMLEAVAHAPPALLKVGAVFAGLTALLGPLIFALGAIGTFIAVRFAKGFGLIGRAISFVFAPLETLLSMAIEFGSARAVMAGLGMIGRSFLGIVGPIGWAVAAFMLFKDSVVPVLEQIGSKLVTTLGPPLQAIMQKVQGIFAQISNGPIGAALSFLGTVISGLVDVIGTLLAGVLAVLGDVLVRVLAVAVAAIGGFVDAVSGMVTFVSDILSGDFSGAWNALVGVIGSIFDTIIDMAVALVPEMEMQTRLVYEAAKLWLYDGFVAIGDWFGAAVANMVDYVASAFPAVVAAAKSVYDGVKGWLVDKFGAVIDWVKNAAQFIGDAYQAMKQKLGLGVAIKVEEPKSPTSLSKVKDLVGPKKTVDLEKPAKGKKGRNTKYDAANRAELETQAQIEAARLRNDHETVRALEDRLALMKQIEAYQRTGLSLADATTAANRDVALIAKARAQQTTRQLADDRLSHQIRIADIAGNGVLEEILQRQEQLQRRIRDLRQLGLGIVGATARATAEQLELESAIADQRQRAAIAAEAQRQIDLARSRGDSEERIRSLQQAEDIRRKSEDFQRGADGRAPMDKAKADALAVSEAMESEQARQTGIFRDTIKGGFRAALDNNFGSWFSSWWKDRVAKGMEDALNSLADLIANLFGQIGKNGSSGGGGIFGAIGSALGSIFGGGKSAAAKSASAFSLPGFKTGGSFKVGGMSGIDNNLVQFRATKGEMVDITRPGNDNGPRDGDHYTFHNDFRGADAAAVTGINARLDRFERELPGKIVGTVSDAKTRGVLR